MLGTDSSNSNKRQIKKSKSKHGDVGDSMSESSSVKKLKSKPKEIKTQSKKKEKNQKKTPISDKKKTNAEIQSKMTNKTIKENADDNDDYILNEIKNSKEGEIEKIIDDSSENSFEFLRRKKRILSTDSSDSESFSNKPLITQSNKSHEKNLKISTNKESTKENDSSGSEVFFSGSESLRKADKKSRKKLDFFKKQIEPSFVKHHKDSVMIK